MSNSKVENCKTFLDMLNTLLVSVILVLVLLIVAFVGMSFIQNEESNLPLPTEKSKAKQPLPAENLLSNFLLQPQKTEKHLQFISDVCSVPDGNRFDCFPENGVSQESCNKRGCCYVPAAKGSHAPECFFASNYSSYSVSSMSQSATGLHATLKRNTTTMFSKDSMTLQLDVEYQTDERLRIRLYDPAVQRYEVPLAVPQGSSVKDRQYDVTVSQTPFSIKVTRKSTGEAVFDTSDTAPLIFSDQYLQISTKLSSPFLYGLGEHQGRFLQNVSTFRKLVFWNHDNGPSTDRNLYGTHPLYLNLEQHTQSSGSRNAHGVFLLSSNAGEVAFSPYGGPTSGSVTYRMLGGILDFFIMMGPNPLSVSQQYTDVVGRPHLPSFWELGYQLCRYGYGTKEELAKVIARNREFNIPYDAQWTDIDIMDRYLDWTYDHVKFSNLSDIVKDLHDNNQRYCLMADPGISSTQKPGTYPPFDDGEKMNIWVKNVSGQNLIARVWPGDVTFPDFFNPDASAWWIKAAQAFHDQIPFDGMWIDMNDPSDFTFGSESGCPKNNTYDYPPYTPPSIKGGSLISKTICPSAKHYYKGGTTEHYNVHNMYGTAEANVSRQMLTSVVKKRAPIISRSSFPGHGQWAGHWTGDIAAGYSNMAFTISEMLNFNLFGISQVGADICGFQTNTNPELCVRWHQLAAFYTFMRNHNNKGCHDQDPAVFDSPYKDHIKTAIQLHYTLLPVLYNMFMESHMHGTPIIRPLFYLYPGTEAIDAQLMWGDSILVSPVLEEKATSVSAYLPTDTWYDGHTYEPVAGTGGFVTLDAPLDKINFHIRGGSILPLLPNTTRTDLSRKEPFTLVIAPNASKSAEGQLYWDDGENLDTSLYSHIVFSAKEGQMSSQVVTSVYRPPAGMVMNRVRVLGQENSPSAVTVDDKAVKFTFDSKTKLFEVASLTIDLLKPFTMTWK